MIQPIFKKHDIVETNKQYEEWANEYNSMPLFKNNKFKTYIKGTVVNVVEKNGFSHIEGKDMSIIVIELDDGEKLNQNYLQLVEKQNE